MRILSRSLALVFAVALVSAMGLALHSDLERWFEPPIMCICIVLPFDDTVGWQRLAAGSFTLSAPDETALHQTSGYDGVVVDRRFTLVYSLDDRVNDEAYAKSGHEYREEEVMVGGRPGVIRSAKFPGRKEPYFLQLVVPRADRTKNGYWLTLEIRGWMASYERWQLARKVMRSVDFTPPFDPQVAPPRIKAELPTFDIAPPTP